MFCPRCGQQQVKQEVRFCSRCGFLMTGMSGVVREGGLPPQIADKSHPDAVSPKKRGVKQGALLMLSSLIIVPLMAILVAAIGINPVLVALTAVVTFWGGLLRIVYSLIFESSSPTLRNEGFVDSVKQHFVPAGHAAPALPKPQSHPIPESYRPPVGNWRDSSDLQPSSVTEETTRALGKEKFERR